jgi:putative tricarboxylic transport membrane protein
MGALIAQGLVPGPSLIQNNPDTFYSLFISMFIAMIALAAIGTLAIRFASSVLSVSKPVLFSLVALLCFAGTYAVNSSTFDVGIMVLFGFAGWIMRKLDIAVPPLVLAFILSRIIEDAFRRSLIQGDGSLTIFLHHPIAMVILGFTVLVLLSIPYGQWRERQRGRQLEGSVSAEPQ